MSDFQEVAYDNSLEGDISVPVQVSPTDDDELSTLDEPVRVTFVSFYFLEISVLLLC